MAQDPNPALRAELVAALAVLVPQIRGLQIIADDPTISDDLANQVKVQIEARSHRRDLIQAVLNALDNVVAQLDALQGGGYPDLPPVTLADTLFAELQEENTDFEAAVAIFAMAKGIVAGPIAFSTNPNPPTAPGP